MKQVAFIINPNSAKKNHDSFLQQLLQKVEAPCYLISKSLEDTEAFIRQKWSSIEVFVAVGGDGTISTVAKNLIHSDKILAIFPQGSGNGFARETHFTKDLDGLLKKLESKKYKEIDTFSVNGNFAVNMAGVGFDGAVAEKFEKTSRGFRNYIKTTLSTYADFVPIQVHFSKGLEQWNGSYLMLNFANTRQFGNNAYIAPHADLSDGLLEIALVKKFPLTYALDFGIRMFSKKLVANAYIQYLSSPEIEFSVDTSKWHLDGEFYELSSPVHVKINPKSLKILID